MSERTGTPITDSATLEAMTFIDTHYAKMGRRQPEAGSVEEQHAISVLSAYIRAQGRGGDEVLIKVKPVDRQRHTIYFELDGQICGVTPERFDRALVTP